MARQFIKNKQQKASIFTEQLLIESVLNWPQRTWKQLQDVGVTGSDSLRPDRGPTPTRSGQSHGEGKCILLKAKHQTPLQSRVCLEKVNPSSTQLNSPSKKKKKKRKGKRKISYKNNKKTALLNAQFRFYELMKFKSHLKPRKTQGDLWIKCLNEVRLKMSW